MQIDQARPADLPAIRKMIAALSAFHGEEATVTLVQLQHLFFSATVPSTALLARKDEVVIGYAGLNRFPVLHFGIWRMDIHHLYVSETHRAKGVGRALIAAARNIAWAENAASLTIGTDPGNATAQAAYRAMGLEEITGTGPRFRIPL